MCHLSECHLPPADSDSVPGGASHFSGVRHEEPETEFLLQLRLGVSSRSRATLKGKGREICLDPNAPWVKNVIEKILANKKP
ncbi:permeability factor 2-like isoform X1 [Arapaima gigas]